MAYTRTWDNATPAGSEVADTLDTIIQNLKTDIEERMIEWFGVADMAATSAQTNALGTWVSKTKDTSYEALTDGFVTCSLIQGVHAGSVANCIGYTSSSNPPTTERESASVHYNYNVKRNGFSMPVKKGDFWKVTFTQVSGGTTACTLFWIPLS